MRRGEKRAKGTRTFVYTSLVLSVCVFNGKVNPCWVSHPSVPHGDLSSSQNVSQTNEVMLGARIQALLRPLCRDDVS